VIDRSLLSDTGKYRAAPGLSKACRDYVIDRLLLGIQPTAIQQQWRAEMHVQYAQKHGLQSAQAAERAMNQVQQCHFHLCKLLAEVGEWRGCLLSRLGIWFFAI